MRKTRTLDRRCRDGLRGACHEPGLRRPDDRRQHSADRPDVGARHPDQERHRRCGRRTIAGEKLNVIMLDDATDPTIGVKNARRFITEDKVDLIVGSAATPIAAAMSDVAAEGQTVQLMLSPVNLPEGKGAWSFRMPQSTAVMAIPIVEHWKKTRRQDLRLPRLLRRLRRSLAEGHRAARREGRHQADRDRALRAHRHQRDRPGAEAGRRRTRMRSSSSPRAAARRCRTRAWSSAATRRPRSTRPTARPRWT